MTFCKLYALVGRGGEIFSIFIIFLFCQKYLIYSLFEVTFIFMHFFKVFFNRKGPLNEGLAMDIFPPWYFVLPDVLSGIRSFVRLLK